jgi:hypothetical protein
MHNAIGPTRLAPRSALEEACIYLGTDWTVLHDGIIP